MSFWISFWLTNIHFAIGLFGGLTSLVVAYVLFVTWNARKEVKTFIRGLGFVLLALFYFTSSAGDISALSFPFWQMVLQLVALVFILVSFILDPVQGVPVENEEVEKTGETASVPLLIPVISPVVAGGLGFVNSLLIGILGWRVFAKYRRGFEKELKYFFLGVVVLFFSSLVTSLGMFKETEYVLLGKLSADFGVLWMVSHLLDLFGFILIATWAWGYLRFKLVSQIIGGFVMASLLIFVTTTFVYTSLLVQSMQSNFLEDLRINLQLFEYSLERLKGQALATASVVASNKDIAGGLSSKNQGRLTELAGEQLVSSKMDFLAILDEKGKVLARGEDPEAIGDMISSSIVSDALDGDAAVEVARREWIGAPQVFIEAAVPVAEVGVVYAGYIVDNAFVDGVKEAAGLDVTVYGGDVKSATTLTALDGVSRLVGVKETNETITSTVLEGEKIFLGLTRDFGREYLSAYGPLSDSQGKILGMLAVGYPSIVMFETAQAALTRTFSATAVLAVISMIPAYFLAKFIEKHQV